MNCNCGFAESRENRYDYIRWVNENKWNQQRRRKKPLVHTEKAECKKCLMKLIRQMLDKSMVVLGSGNKFKRWAMKWDYMNINKSSDMKSERHTDENISQQRFSEQCR